MKHEELNIKDEEYRKKKQEQIQIMYVIHQ